MSLPYRTKRRLLRLGIVLLAIALTAVLIWGCWLLWLHKHVYYTADNGAVLDFNLGPISGEGHLAEPPGSQPTIPIYYNEGDAAINTSKELTQIIGYYVSPEELADLPALRAQIRALPQDVPVMLDVKTIYGAFNYSSSVSTSRNSQVDSQEMDSLIQDLAASGRYLIARLPGLRDKEFGLNHVDDGVFHSSRGYLYMDDQGCYWLNPAREATVTHLTQIVNELKGMGFDEVVFYDFTFPATDSIYFDGDKAQALSATAQTLVTTCSTESFAVSFVSSEGFQPPEGRSRLYLENAAAADAANIAQNSGLEDPTAKLVFLTDNHDTRFDAYSVLRPLATAH